jgi:DNA-binding HxlR family transcriptional regulator
MYASDMPIEAFARQNCSIARTLAFLGERWTVLILRELFVRRQRFDQIQAELGVATNVLSERLSTLLDEGIVDRRRYSEHPERYEYRLTEKGRDLQPIMLELMKWGARHKPLARGPMRVMVHTECGHEVEPVQICSHCGGELDKHNVRAPLGPGATAEQRRREASYEAERRQAA